MSFVPPSEPLGETLGSAAPLTRRQAREAQAARPRAARRGAPAAPRTPAPPAARTVDRRSPFAVLGTMVVVGGLFAVVGLPAYAMTPGDEDAVATQALSAQSLKVSADAIAESASRDGYKATTPEQLAQMTRDSVRAGNTAEYLASGARELGDDYPWAYELSVDQGGGLSPLNYYYRQCTDFVAWRINRDAGSTEAPYKYVWSNLTPSGGDAYQWRSAWQRHGWTVSSTPVVGAVAWFSSNHVGYVKQVLADGSVLIEEYNYIPNVYSQRTLKPSEVDAFLYPPSD